MKTKIFLASNPHNPNNNLRGFYSNLMSNDFIEVLHVATIEDLKEDSKGKVIEHELARIDKINILNSEFVIIDTDTETRTAYPYWACVNPNSKIILIGQNFSLVPDPFYAERVVASIKPDLLIPILSLLISESQEEVSPDKQDQVLD